MQRAVVFKMFSGRVTFQDLGIDTSVGGGGLDGDGGNLDGELESEEDKDEVDGGVGTNLVHVFGINEDQLHNQLTLVLIKYKLQSFSEVIK